MNDFVIVTDSSCDLPNDLVQKLELHVVPLAFIMGDKTYWNYPDNREMSPEDFYGRQKQGQMATTNAVNVGQATDVLEPILKQGKDLLVLAFSSGLSTTCNSFQIAATELGAQYPDRKVFVVDTLCASLGQGMLVARAVENQERGLSLEENAAAIREDIPHLAQYAAKEANPLYPVPRLLDAEALEVFYYKAADRRKLWTPKPLTSSLRASASTF